MPNVIRMQIAYDTDFSNVATVHVLTEGAVGDVAAYRMTWNNNDLAEKAATRVMHDTARYGVKLTEREATLVFTVPDGKHYRR